MLNYCYVGQEERREIPEEIGENGSKKWIKLQIIKQMLLFVFAFWPSSIENKKSITTKVLKSWPKQFGQQLPT